MKDVRFHLQERHRQIEAEQAEFEMKVENKKQVLFTNMFKLKNFYTKRNEMRKTIEEYKNHYETYLKKVEKIDGLSEIRELQKEFEAEKKK